MEVAPVKKTVTHLADGRELIYFDSGDAEALAAYPDTRPLDPVVTSSETRYDPVLGEWVSIAAHRQGRTYHPPANSCPLCPSTDQWQSEIPAPRYEVVVFENRFPALAGAPTEPDTVADPAGESAIGLARPGGGRCEVVCFTSEHDSSFAALDQRQAGVVLEAWTDRTAELSALPGIRQVYCFENRGSEIGVSLSHPHGQIYAFPFVTPKTARAVANAAAYRASTGRNLFDDLLAAELAGPRVVIDGEHWVAFVPFAARWPYEAHLYPKRRVADFTRLNDAERADFPRVYLELLRRFDRLFDRPQPTPYIAAWHQAPVAALDDRSAPELALHLELFTVQRTADKLKYLAGTESGMGAFMNDVTPERAAARLREVSLG
jgi:UDPglucose--hexose-1-phosphate uridylyltransferase